MFRLFNGLALFLVVSCASHRSGVSPHKHSAWNFPQGALGAHDAHEVFQRARREGGETARFLSDDFFLKGQDAAMRGQAQTAELFFRYAAALGPDDAHLQKRHSLELIKLGRLEEALEVLKLVHQRAPDEELAMVIGGLYGSAGQRAQAKAAYKGVLANNPKNIEACLSLAQLYGEEKSFPQAHTLLKDCEKKNPTRGIFAYLRGKLSLETGRIKLARRFFRQALKVEHGLWQAHLSLGLMAEELRDLPRAKKIYDNYLSRYDSENLPILLRLGAIFVQGEWAPEQGREMLPHLERLSHLNPNDLGLKLRIGLLYADLQDLPKAIGAFKEILVVAPDSDRVHYYLGALYRATLKLDKSLDHLFRISKKSEFFADGNLLATQILVARAYEKFQKGDPSWDQGPQAQAEKAHAHPDERLRLGVAVEMAALYESVNNVPRAVGLLEKVASLEGFSDHHALYLASLYDKVKHFDRVDEVVLQILENSPNNAQALNLIGYSLLEREGGDLQKAFEFISQAVKLGPNDGHIRDSLGWFYYKTGHLEKALVELSRAFELESEDAVIARHLATVHRDLNNTQKAKKYYQKALAQCKTQEERLSIERDLRLLEHGQRLPASVSSRPKAP